jgi:hypothetical protein
VPLQPRFHESHGLAGLRRTSPLRIVNREEESYEKHHFRRIVPDATLKLYRLEEVAIGDRRAVDAVSAREIEVVERAISREDHGARIALHLEVEPGWMGWIRGRAALKCQEPGVEFGNVGHPSSPRLG